jgi:hypothetical protein
MRDLAQIFTWALVVVLGDVALTLMPGSRGSAWQTQLEQRGAI